MSGEQEEELYDEFGNYIGPDLDDESSSEEEEENDDDDDDGDDRRAKVQQPLGAVQDDASDVSVEDGDNRMIVVEASPERQLSTEVAENAIVLHEDKEHYPSADQVYGEDVRTAVLDEDAMELETPIVEPVITKSQYIASAGDGSLGSASNYYCVQPDDWMYTEDYLAVQLSNETTRTRRGIAIVGHLHHGKTTLVDLLLEKTLRTKSWDATREQHIHKKNKKNKEKDASNNNNNTSSSFKSIAKTTALDVKDGGGPRYLDTLVQEQDRQMSLVSTPLTALFPDTRGKTYAFTILDCPGHPNFHDESVAALKIVDGAVVVVDVLETGIMMHTEMVVRQAVAEGLPICLVLNKMDRLIVELRLPPRDAYYKLLNIIDSMNNLIGQISHGRYPKLSPERGNVAFASAQHGWVFTLESFAQVYLDHQANTEEGMVGLGDNLSVSDFAKRLWGDAFLDPTTKTFHWSARECPSGDSSIQRTFVTFILDPIYKIYSACLGEREVDVAPLLRQLGVFLTRDQLRSNARTLLRTALSQFLDTATLGFVDMVVQHIPHPSAAAPAKIARCYTGPQGVGVVKGVHAEEATKESAVVSAMKACDPNGPLVIHVVKLYANDTATASTGEDGNVEQSSSSSSPSSSSFWAFGRIYSGTVRPATRVRVLGEGYVPDLYEEDAAEALITAVAIPRGRSRTQASVVKAGNWVLLQGVDATISKTATIVGVSSGAAAATSDPFLSTTSNGDQVHIFAPLKFPQAGGESVVKLSIEPLNPAELPKMVEGLRKINKAYPMARTKVEESGEHILLGTGELYMDCIMHDLRQVYSDIEVKVADPITSFRETVVETSSLKCFAETTNKRNKLTFIAEPLDDGLAEQLEAGKVNIRWDKKKLGRYFQTKYNWDLLSSRSVWAFGDSPTHGTNILMDDTLPSEVDKKLLIACRSSIVQGFQWATREGPLCEEPVRATKIKLLDVVLADKPIHRGGGQIIPTARRTVHSSLLTATPRLMEPVYRLQIQCPGSIVDALQPVLSRRRGHIVQDKPISGTLLYSVSGFLPVLDSFGFETDLRTFTQGQAMVFSVFDHWSVVPGDPLDRSIILHPLEPSPQQHLARELLIKTRRRKGLSEDVTVSKFFDDGMKAHLLAQEDGGGVQALQ